MKLLLYAAATQGAAERLQRIIAPLISEREREIYRTIADLSHRLRQPMSSLCVAVLLAATRSELSALLSIRELLADLRLVVILPDLERETVARGHTLRPRFVSHIESDFTDVAAVVNKMLEQER